MNQMSLGYANNKIHRQTKKERKAKLQRIAIIIFIMQCKFRFLEVFNITSAAISIISATIIKLYISKLYCTSM